MITIHNSAATYSNHYILAAVVRSLFFAMLLGFSALPAEETRGESLLKIIEDNDQANGKNYGFREGFEVKWSGGDMLAIKCDKSFDISMIADVSEVEKFIDVLSEKSSMILCYYGKFESIPSLNARIITKINGTSIPFKVETIDNKTIITFGKGDDFTEFIKKALGRIP